MTNPKLFHSAKSPGRRSAFFALLLCLALIFSLTACGETQPGSSSDNPVPSSPASPSSADEAALTALQEQLNAIIQLEVGTAGSSLKAVPVAIALLDWAEETTLTAEQIEQSVTSFYESLSQDEKSILSEQLFSLQSCSELLLAGGDSAKALLDDAGAALTRESYSADRLSPLWDAFSALTVSDIPDAASDLQAS